MKIVLICFVILCCWLVGIGLKNYYKNRCDFFIQFIDFLQISKNKIYFEQKKIKEIFADSAITNQTAKTLCGNFLMIIDNNLKIDGNLLFKNCAILKKDEKEQLLTFFCNLGKGDSFSEIKFYETYISNFSFCKEKCENDFNKTGKLYGKLGLLAGCLIAIIFC